MGYVWFEGTVGMRICSYTERTFQNLPNRPSTTIIRDHSLPAEMHF